MKRQLEMFLDMQVDRADDSCEHPRTLVGQYAVSYIKCTCCSSILEAITYPLAAETLLSESASKPHRGGLDTEPPF